MRSVWHFLTAVTILNAVTVVPPFMCNDATMTYIQRCASLVCISGASRDLSWWLHLFVE